MKAEDGKLKLPSPSSSKEATYLLNLNNYLALTLSIPERTARALAAIIGGGTLLLSKTLIPQSIKSSNSYKFTLGMFQSFMIRNVAGLEHVDTGVELSDNFLNRKLLGTSLEAAGLLTMHLSPVWVFAIASDAAKGGQVFLQRLVTHLKENQVIEEDSHPESLEQILLSIQDMASKGASAVDTPPLTIDEVKALADELRKSTASLALSSTQLLPSFETILNQIDQLSRKENLNPEQIMGMLSYSAASLLSRGVGTADAVGKTAYFIIDELILKDYKNTLADISAVGSLAYMQKNMQPFLENAQSHFDLSVETTSQRWFKNGIRRFFRQLRSKK